LRQLPVGGINFGSWVVLRLNPALRACPSLEAGSHPLTCAEIGAVVYHAEQFLVVVAREAGCAVALPVRVQTAPRRRDQVPLSAAEAADVGLRAFASIIDTSPAGRLRLDPSRSPRVLGQAGVALLGRIDRAIRQSRQSEAIEGRHPVFGRA
jgi:hypothetical protein